MAVEITRRELSAASLRQAAARSRDANAARRMLAIALVLEGDSRARTRPRRAPFSPLRGLSLMWTARDLQ